MTLTRRESKLVAVGILVALLAAIWLGAVQPIIHGFQSRSQERTRLIAEQERDERLIAASPLWQARRAALMSDALAYALPVRDTASAGQAATELVSNTIARTGGEVRDLHEQAGSDGLARVHADLRLNLTQLSMCIKLLEDQKPFAIVESLSIAADPAASAGRPATLDVGIDLAVPFVVTNG